jgi:glyoxylase-like metal-dependent hydrolase (beta-lactamase superfamily II)
VTVLRRTLPVGPLQCNCSILVDEATRDALIVDPGDEADAILAAVEEMKARPVALLHTHGHFDHIGASSDVAEATGAALRIHAADRFLWDMLPDQARLFGMEADKPRDPDAAIADGETIAFGSSSVRAIHTPGHTPGSTCFLLEPAKGESGETILFSGDTLFHRSIGRTDLWGGDTETILASIRERLYALDPATRVICGHGEDTTIGDERKRNPFVRLEPV